MSGINGKTKKWKVLTVAVVMAVGFWTMPQRVGAATAVSGTGTSVTVGDVSYPITYNSGGATAGTDATAVGDSATASGDYSIAIGEGSNALGVNSMALGYHAKTDDYWGIAIGSEASVTGGGGLAIGPQATASAYSLAIGVGATASQSSIVIATSTVNDNGNSGSVIIGSAVGSVPENIGYTVAIGSYVGNSGGRHAVVMGIQASVSGDWAVAVGSGVKASGAYSTAIGGANASTDYSIAIGQALVKNIDDTTDSGAVRGIAIGGKHQVGNLETQVEGAARGVAIGNTALVYGEDSLAIGNNISVNGTKSTVIGSFAHAYTNYSFVAGYGATVGTRDDNFNAITDSLGVAGIAIGSSTSSYDTGASVTADYGIAIGTSTSVSGTFSSSIGYGAKTTGNRSMALGLNTGAYTNCSMAIGNGSTVGIKEIGDSGGVGGIAIGVAVEEPEDDVLYIYAEGAKVSADYGIAIGSSSSALAEKSVAFGYGATAGAGEALAIGSLASVEGTYSMAFGSNSFVSAEKSVGIGYDVYTSAEKAVAIGNEAVNTIDGTVSFGHKEGDFSGWYEDAGGHRSRTTAAYHTRAVYYESDSFSRLINVANGIDNHDAATYGQLVDAQAVTSSTTNITTYTPYEADPYGLVTVKTNDGGTAFTFKVGTSSTDSGLVIGDKTNGWLDISWNGAADSTSVTRGTNSTAYGYTANASGANSTAIGYGSLATTDYATALGGAKAYDRYSFVAGYGAAVGTSGATTSAGLGGIAIGSATTTDGRTTGAKVTADYGIAIGSSSAVAGAKSMALGYGASAPAKYAVAIGFGSVAYTENTISVGSDANPRKIVYVAPGSNATDAANYGQLVKKQNYTVSGGTVTVYNNSYTGGDATEDQIAFTISGIGSGGSSIVDYDTNYATSGEHWLSTHFGQTLSHGTDSTAYGYGAVASADKSTAIGYMAKALDYGAGDSTYPAASTAIGAYSSASTWSTALGYNATASGAATAIGYNATASHTASIAIGYKVVSEGSYATVLGSGAAAHVDFSLALGAGATVGTSVQESGGAYGIAVGTNTSVTADKSVALGYGASATAENAVALGQGSVADIANTISVGSSAETGGFTRKIVNVTAGSNATDAANYGQIVTGGSYNSSTGTLTFTNGAGKTAFTIDGITGGGGTGTTYTAGNGIVIDTTSTTHTISAKVAEKGGLSLDGNGLAIKTAEKGGLSVDEIGLAVKVAEKGALSVDGNGLAVKVAENGGLTADGNGLSVQKDGEVTSGNTGIVTGGTVYNSMVTNGSYDSSTGRLTFTNGKGDTSFSVAINGSGVIYKGDDKTIAISDNNEFSVKYDTTDLTVNDNGIAVKKDGKVESGNTGLVTGGTVYDAMKTMDNQVSQLSDDIKQVGAGAAALAALHPEAYDPNDKVSFAVGYGHYKGANAGALGAFFKPNADTTVSVASTIGNGDPMVNMGVSFKLGNKGKQAGTYRSAVDLVQRVDAIEAAVVKEIKRNDIQDSRLNAQERKIAQLQADIARMQQQIASILSESGMAIH